MLSPWISASELREIVVKKEVSPREVANFFIARTEKLNPKVGAFMTITPEHAIADADRIAKLTAEEARRCPLYGVAYSLKDLTWTKDIRTTMGSKNFENFIPPVDVDYVVKLRNAGGILLGKTTTPEFGGRPTTEGGLCPPARNPWNLAHTAGGSSGGAAAAVAAGLGPIAEGSDGGGSIRIPSACCGLVGLKPSRGRVSFSPTAGEAWAGFATSGPIGRTVKDVATMLDVMHGAAIGDPYSAPAPATSFASAADAPPRKLKLGLIAKSSVGKVDPETVAALESAAKLFEQMGHRVDPLEIDPAGILAEVCSRLIAAGVASTPVPNPELMDPVVRAMWESGQGITAREYINVVMQMHNLSREIVQKLNPYDAILTPTLTRPAVKLGSLPSSPQNSGELFEWLPFTFPFNATGQPAFSLPNGFSKEGLPIGLQIVGRPADELTIINLAAQFEQARPWKDKHPQLD